MITPQQLVPPALTLGRLIGLLRRQAGSDTVDLDWFQDPLSALQATGTRLDQLVDLLHEVLGKPVSQPDQPAVFAGAQWLRIPNPKAPAGQASPLYAVVPARGKDSGTVGLGVRLTSPPGPQRFTFYAYVPLVKFGPTGPEWLLGRADAPLQLGLVMARETAFTVGAVSFTGVDIQTNIYLTDTTPTARLTFQHLQGSTRPATYDQLRDIEGEVREWLGAAVLQAGSWLNQGIGATGVTPGMLLAATGFLREQSAPATELPPAAAAGPQYALSLEQLADITPRQIALNFLWQALDKLVAADKPLAELPGGGVRAVATTHSDEEARDDASPAGDATAADDDSAPAAPTTYGLNLQLNVPLPTAGAPDGPGAAISLVLGGWLSGEDDEENWLTRSAAEVPTTPPGLTVWLLERDAVGQLGFAPQLALLSAGLDIGGAGDEPLVDLNGYTLQGAELRTALHAPTPGHWASGFAAKLAGLGLPLVPGELGDAAGTSNPVAQSLLQSAAPAGAAEGDAEAANPSFGATVAWHQGGTLRVQLLDGEDTPAEEVLLPINRALGPLFCRRLGIGWVDDERQLSLLFDGAVRVGPLTVDLEGLSVGVPVTAPTDVSRYQLDLRGLGIAFEAGQVSLNAALVQVPPSKEQPYTRYDGAASIQAGTLGISALGSYAWLPAQSGQPGYASLFVFGALLQPLGGPGFFFVTGLAAGFGYNRALRLPAPDQVADFPLVQVLSNPAALGGKKDAAGRWSFPAPTTVLQKLGPVVPPERGQYWLAAGVRFTSFDLVHTSALLSVAFGNELKIGVTGVSWMSLPPPPKPGAPVPDKRFAYVEMGVAVEVLPDEGVLKATALLTSNSYVIDPACRLSGGFAFYTWFGSHPHAGEFVLTIGGYHPGFTVPAHFPRVPRLGFRWPVSDTVTISGDAYFALTPSAIMAGAGLQILFSSGNLKAWFTAQLDALVQWAPFRYDVTIAVSVGVSYRLKLLFVTVTLKVELGASLQLWGPRMGGRAHISWSIISFSVGFGADRPAEPAALPWTDANGEGFAQTLLPHQGSPVAPPRLRRLSAAARAAAGHPLLADAPQPAASGVLTIGQLSGVGSTYQDAAGATVWVVRPGSFRFSALTSFPLTELRTAPAPGSPAPTQWLPEMPDYYVCVRPMRATMARSVLTVTLTQHLPTADVTYDLAGGFELLASRETTQAAKWGRPPLLGAPPQANETLPGRLLGFRSAAPLVTRLTPNGARALHIDLATAFAPEVVNARPPYSPAHLPLASGATPGGRRPHGSPTAQDTIRQSLQNSATTAARTAVYDALLNRFGLLPPDTNGPVEAFAARPDAWLNGQPLLLSTT